MAAGGSQMLRISRSLLPASCALCAWLGTIVPAASTDLGPQPRLAEPMPAPSQWQFSFTPYGWAMSINGDVTARGHKVDVNESFIEIVEKSDSLLAWMSFFEARK